MCLYAIIISTAECFQLCYTSHFVVVVGSGSIGIDVVNKFVLMIVVVACVVSKSPDALVEKVIFLDLDFIMYICFLLLNALFEVVTKIIQCMFYIHVHVCIIPLISMDALF